MKLCIPWLIIVITFYTDAQNDTQIDAQNDTQIDAQSGAEAYLAEGYFVVDDKALNYYINQIHGTESYENKRAMAIAEITEDLDYLLTEANQLLYTLNTYELNVQIRIREITFLTTDVFPGSSLQNGNEISDGIVMELFSDWLTTQNSHSALGYDFALLFTGYDISGDTLGITEMGSVCDPIKAVAVVEFNGTYSTALVTAHEVAHVLGANHDGTESDYVMSFVSKARNRHRWFFSKRSAVYIKETFPRLTPNCLLTTNPASTTPASSWATYKGRLLDLNAVCERAVNDSGSYVCLDSIHYDGSSPKGNKICQQMECYLPWVGNCFSRFTSEGVICDNRKRCDNGKCVPDTSAASANVDPECVFGDQKVVEISGENFKGSCQQLINQLGLNYCRPPSNVANLCCATCKKFKTNIQELPWSSPDEDKVVDTVKDETQKDVKVDEFKPKITNNTSLTNVE